MLFDLATARLLDARVLLPGPTVLSRLVASVRDHATIRLWESVAAVPDAAQRTRLEELLAIRDGERGSTLDRLRRGPTSVTGCWARCTAWRRSCGHRTYGRKNPVPILSPRIREVGHIVIATSGGLGPPCPTSPAAAA
jgi:hypothetical protein